MATIVKVLNSVAALGADATVSNGALRVAGVNIPIRSIRPSSNVQAYVAEQLQITTVTPTAADSTVYSLTIQGRSTVDQSNKTWTATVTSAVGATATTICNQFRVKFNAMADVPCTFSGTATLIVTGISGSPKFSCVASANNVGTLGFGATQAAIIGYGGGALLVTTKAPLPESTDAVQIVSTNNYTTVTIDYQDNTAVDTRNSYSTNLSSLILYVNQGDTDYPALVGTYGSITQALKGVVATHVTATGTMAVTQTTGALELAGGGTFSVDAAIQPGDIAYPATFAYYPVVSILDTNSGLTSNTAPASLGAAAFTWVTLRASV